MIALFSYRTYRPFVLLTTMLLSLSAAIAETPEPQFATSPQRIARAVETIHTAEQDHRPETERGILWMQLALEYQYAADFPKSEDAYDKALNLLKNAPGAREEYAATLESLATLYLIYGKVDDAESLRKQAIAVRQKLGNAYAIGFNQIHLANIALARHQFKKAEQLAARGMEEMESSSNPARVGILSGYVTLTYARCSRGHCSEGLINAQQGLAYANKNFDPESAAVGFALETLGFAEWKTGAPEDGEKSMLRGIQLLKAKLAPTDPRVAGALLQYQDYLNASGRRVEAQVIHAEVDRMTSQSATFCPGCTVNVNSLSKTLR